MKISLIGPVYPYRGGIAHHTALLAKHLSGKHDLQLISFLRLYPHWLFPGRGDRDPSHFPLRADAEYILDPLNPITWKRAAQRIHQFQPELLILPWWVVFLAPTWLGLIWLVRRRTKARVLFLCHNVLPHEGGAWQSALARLVLTRADAAVVQSRAELVTLAQLVPNLKIAYNAHPTYADIGQMLPGDKSPPEQREATSDIATILFFGFVRPYKGLHVLLDAMPAVLTSQPARLWAVGEVWGDRGEYDAHIARLGLTRNVQLVDEYVPNERLGEYFRAADVVVLPYLSATQSGVAQLAFGFGIPVIASCVGGLPDTVQDGQTGLLVAPGDPHALAEAIIRFFRERLGTSMRANIREQQERFSWAHMVETIEMLAAEAT